MSQARGSRGRNRVRPGSAAWASVGIPPPPAPQLPPAIVQGSLQLHASGVARGWWMSPETSRGPNEPSWCGFFLSLTVTSAPLWPPRSTASSPGLQTWPFCFPRGAGRGLRQGPATFSTTVPSSTLPGPSALLRGHGVRSPGFIKDKTFETKQSFYRRELGFQARVPGHPASLSRQAHKATHCLGAAGDGGTGLRGHVHSQTREKACGCSPGTQQSGLGSPLLTQGGGRQMRSSS